MLKKILAIAIEIFRAYLTKDEVHITSDGQPFFEKHFAEAHCQTLDCKDITSLTRDKVEKHIADGVLDVVEGVLEGAASTTDNSGNEVQTTKPVAAKEVKPKVEKPTKEVKPKVEKPAKEVKPKVEKKLVEKEEAKEPVTSGEPATETPAV